MAQNRGAGAGTGDAGPAASTPTSSRSKPATQRMMDRLESIYESGKVMPVAFLSAASAAPLALLDHSSAGRRDAYRGDGVASRGQNAAARKLVSDLAVEGELSSVPQQLRENYKKQVSGRRCCCYDRPLALKWPQVAVRCLLPSWVTGTAVVFAAQRWHWWGPVAPAAGRQTAMQWQVAFMTACMHAGSNDRPCHRAATGGCASASKPCTNRGVSQVPAGRLATSRQWSCAAAQVCRGPHRDAAHHHVPVTPSRCWACQRACWVQPWWPLSHCACDVRGVVSQSRRSAYTPVEFLSSPEVWKLSRPSNT